MCVCVMAGGGVGGRGSLIETRHNKRFRSRIVKLLRNKSHSFDMTSPPYENVSFSGFKKNLKKEEDKLFSIVKFSGAHLTSYPAKHVSLLSALFLKYQVLCS